MNRVIPLYHRFGSFEDQSLRKNHCVPGEFCLFRQVKSVRKLDPFERLILIPAHTHLGPQLDERSDTGLPVAPKEHLRSKE
jgi:hypothetical protein